MADKNIGSLPTAGTLSGSDFLHIEQGGNSRKVSLSTLKSWINTDPTVLPASVPYRGALARRTSDLTGLTSGTMITWQATSYDTNSFWSAGAPTRLTIPTGVTRVRFFWALNCEAMFTVGTVAALLRKNGLALASGSGEHWAGAWGRQDSTGFNDNRAVGFSQALPVVAGDYFEINFQFSMAGMDQVLFSASSFFEVQVLESTL